jgi:hypothetical protein
MSKTRIHLIHSKKSLRFVSLICKASMGLLEYRGVPMTCDHPFDARLGCAIVAILILWYVASHSRKF